MLKKQRFGSIVGVVLSVVLILWIIIFAYRQTVALNSLRFESEGIIKSIYKLSNSSYSMLYMSKDLKEARKEWYDAYLETTNNLEKLLNHKNLSYISSDSVDQIKQIYSLWVINATDIRDCNVNLTNFFQYKLDVKKIDNLNNVLIELEKLKEQNNMNKKYYESLEKQYTFVYKIYTQVKKSNDNIWETFVHPTEKNVDAIDAEIRNVIQFILIVSAVLAFLLLMLLFILIITRQRILRKVNLQLEETVKSRSASIQSLLDTSGEGFLSFGKDFKVNSDHSKECNKIFKKEVKGENIASLLYDDPNKQKEFLEGMELVFDNISLPEVVFNVLDNKIKINERVVKINFYFIDKTTIMCKLIDISQNELLQQKLEEENLFKDMCLRVVVSKHDFLALKVEAEELFTNIQKYIVDNKYGAEKAENDENIRKLHTFKANAGFLKMRKTERSSQELETAMIDYGVLSDSSPIDVCFLELRKSFKDENEKIAEILGKDWDKEINTVEVDFDILENIKQHIESNYPEDVETINSINELVSFDLSILFTKISDLIEDLAISNGKRINLKIDCDGVYVSTNLYNRLSEASIHILKNIVTHGIEFPGHRRNTEKPLIGQIEITATQKDDNLELVFTDDGVGISPEKIKEKAIKMGRIDKDVELEDNDYIKMIFLPGFSTSDTVTEISGRGYGLSIVKESIYEIGGKIKVASVEGRGTKVTLLVPNNMKLM